MNLDAEAQAFKAQLAPVTKVAVLDLDEATAATTLPDTYVVIFVSPRFGGVERASGTRSTDLRRLSTRVISKSVTNARRVESRIAGEFEFSRVTYEAGGGDFDQDGVWFFATTDWTYTT